MRKFLWATINVRDMEESLRFYQEVVGLTIDRRYQARPGVEITFLGKGETKIELIKNDEIKDINIGENISLGFEVDSVDDMMEFVRLRASQFTVAPPSQIPTLSFSTS